MAKKKQDELTDAEVDAMVAEALPELFVKDEEEVSVRVNLPRAVVYALIDPTFYEADVHRALVLGLLDPSDPNRITAFGHRVLDGCDVTALRHKIIRAKRASQV